LVTGVGHLLFCPELPLASRLEPARLCLELPLASLLEPARLYPQPRRLSVHVRSLAAQFWAQREWPALPRQQFHQD
jgi:hypothetical protein